MVWRRKKRVDTRKLILSALAAVNAAQLELSRSEWRLKSMTSRIPEAKALLEKIFFYNILLEKIKIRLNTILISGILNRELIAPIYEAVKIAEDTMKGLPPTVASPLMELETILATLYETLPSTEEPEMVMPERQATEEAKRILSLAQNEARKRLEEIGQTE